MVKLTDEVAVGISGYIKQHQTGPSGDDHESRFRAGTDVSYIGPPVFLRGEYILRKVELPGGGSLKMNGGYLLGGYQFMNELQTIIRYDYYEPNTSWMMTFDYLKDRGKLLLCGKYARICKL